MSTISPPIYSRDTLGKIRQWQVEVDGPRYRAITGLVDGAKVEAGWTYSIGKNIGRANATTPEQQCASEANADRVKKLDRDYRRTVAELDTVPPSPMLAQDFAKQKSVPLVMDSQPKLDGIRALTSRHGAFSRQYQRHMNVDHILDHLAPLFDQYPGLILDGELYNHDLKDDFNQIASVVRKQNVGPADRARAKTLIQMHVYDCIMDTPYGRRRHELGGFEDRYAFLKGELTAYAQDTRGPIQIVETTRVTDQIEMDIAYGAYLEAGYEGQMLRDPAGLYEVDKRSKGLLKRKEFLDGEFELLSIAEGVGNWAGYAKRVTFRQPDGQVCGAGMRGNQAFARQLLGDAPRYIGGQVSIRYFTPTPDGVFRFPVATDFHASGRRD